MKPKKLKNLIKRTRSALRWQIIDRPNEKDIPEIISDPETQTHTIFYPEIVCPNDPPREIEYLHELAHATLCEKVHTCFSTQDFVDGTPECYICLIPIFRTATDWFADQWLMESCPDLERTEIEECFNLAQKIERTAIELIDVGKLYMLALILAQGIKYLGKRNLTVGLLGEIVLAFLSIRPDNPTQAKFETLINRLAAPCYPLRVRMVDDGQFDAWELLQILDATQ